MKTIFYILLSILLSCSHTQPEKRYLPQHKIEKGSCLEKLNTIEQSRLKQTYNVMAQGAGTGASYVLTGAGYTADAAIIVVGGIGVGAIACSPIILLEASLNGSGDASGRCIGNVMDKVFESKQPDMGGSAYKKTKKWRCPKVDHISKALRKVASCYKQKGELQLAKEQLYRINNDRLLRTCSSKEEIKKLKLQKKL